MPANVVHPLTVPSLLIVGVGERIGKTVVASAISDFLSRDGQSVGVFKPFDTFCEHRREGRVSGDAEFLATASKTHHPLDLIAPIRSSTKQPPAFNAEPVAWELLDGAAAIVSRDSDVVIIEPTPGLLDPVDASLTMLDIAAQLRTKAVIVAQASQPLHLVLIHLLALKCAGVPVAGVVINKYPPGTATASEESHLRSIEKIAKTRLLTVLPDEPVSKPFLPAGIVEAIGKVDWLAIAKGK